MPLTTSTSPRSSALVSSLTLLGVIFSFARHRGRGVRPPVSKTAACKKFKKRETGFSCVAGSPYRIVVVTAHSTRRCCCSDKTINI